MFSFHESTVPVKLLMFFLKRNLYAWSSAITGLIAFVCFKFYRLNREWAEANESPTTEAA